MLKYLILAACLGFLFVIRRALIPVAVGLVIAYVLNPYVDKLSRKLGGRRLLCVFIAYLTVLCAVFFLIWGFARIISGKVAAGSLQESFATLRAYYLTYQDILSDYLGISLSAPDIPRLLQQIGNGVLTAFLGMMAGVYLLCDKDFFLRLGSQTMHLFLPQKAHGIIREILFEIDAVIGAFLRGVFVDSVIVAFLSSLALALLQVDYSVFIGCFAGISNIIPYFGPVLGMIPAFFAAFTEQGLLMGLLAAAALFGVQQIECNFIYPRIIGKSTGLHPLFILAAVSAAGALGGLLWMVLAVPICGIIKVLLTKWAENQ